MRHLKTILALTTVLSLAAPAAQAATRSLKAPFVKERATDLSVEDAGIRVTRYRFSPVIRGTQNPLKAFAGGPSVLFEVRNEGAEPRDFALAVALFDARGALVGVGTQSHTGRLDPAESSEVKIVLKDVNQNVRQAATMILTLETPK